MSAAYILAAVRTPGGKAKKGKLKDVRPDDLAAVAIRALLDRTGVDPRLVEDVILGCAFPEGEQGMNVARIAALRAGLPVEVPGQTVNRFCASGLQAIATAAERILAGGADCLIAGGTESMSLIPMGGQKFSANPGLAGAWPESYAAMGITAELVAAKYGVSRADQDAFAAESHRRAARRAGRGAVRRRARAGGGGDRRARTTGSSGRGRTASPRTRASGATPPRRGSRSSSPRSSSTARSPPATPRR